MKTPLWTLACLLAAPATFAQVPLATLAGNLSGDALFFGVSLGDLDADGVPDFAVGAPNANGGNLTVYSGADFAILGVLTGANPGDAFGFRAAPAGTVQSNGHPILAVGARGHDGGGADAGRVYFFEFVGPNNWVALQTVDGSPGDQLGASVAAAGDVDGDGRLDVVVGAPGHDGPAGVDAGRVLVLGDAGGTGSGWSVVGAPLEGPSAGAEYGAAVQGAGDIDGDTRDDVIVGAPGADVARVLAFDGVSWSTVWTFAATAGDLFGTSVRAADLNSDDVPDPIVGAPEDDVGTSTDVGSVFVFDGATGTPLYTASGSSTLGYYFGYSIDVADDLDGDTVPDLVVGVPEAYGCDRGGVHVLSGVDGTTLHEMSGDLDGDGLGNGVAALGDLTGDGLPEILAGAPQEGIQEGSCSEPVGTGYVRIYTGWSAIGTRYCTPAVDNSTGSPGAIHAFGSASVADDDVSLVAVQLPTSQFGYFLNSQTQGFVQNPGGSQGNLCLGGAIGRYTKFVAGTGDAGSLTLVLDLTQTPTPSGPVAVQPGQTWQFQTWFRDKNPQTTSNFTDAVAITFL